MSKKAVPVQQKFRRNAYIFERVEIETRGEIAVSINREDPGAVLPRIHPNVGAAAMPQNGFGGVWALRVSRRSATRQRLRP